MEAVIHSDYEGVKKLVMNGASVVKKDWSGCDCLIHALRKNEWEILSLCLDFSKQSIDLNKKFFVCFFSLVFSFKLFEKSTKNTYLIMAAQNSQAKIIKCLSFHKADPNACDLVHLNIALKEFHLI